MIRVYRHASAPPKADKHVIWRDPGEVGQLDLACGPGGPGGAPAPPFRFVQEHHSGSSPCVSVTDARGRSWRVKWGNEVRSEAFGVRMAWAAGYFAEAAYFVPSGRIERPHTLARAASCIRDDGSFEDARFELEEAGVEKRFDEKGWSWIDNPFVGTPALNGLKIVMMLLSNWDNKDVRDVARGSNTAIFHYALSDGTREARYLIIDWGATMGAWGATIVTRGRWDPAAYAAQTPHFVTAVEDGTVQWGYTGQRTADAVEGITVADVAWLYRYLGQLRDEQIRDALAASGAIGDELDRFTSGIRERLNQLKTVAAGLHPGKRNDSERRDA
jgi:hypothetical protein